MAKTVQPKDLEAEISKILDKYENQVQENLEAVTKEIAQKGAKQIQANARQMFGGTGKYAKGWTTTDTGKRFAPGRTIHHKSMPGLPHLLENGHVSVVNGRRVGQAKAHPHIAPVEEKIIEEYQKGVMSKL